MTYGISQTHCDPARYEVSRLDQGVKVVLRTRVLERDLDRVLDDLDKQCGPDELKSSRAADPTPLEGVSL